MFRNRQTGELVQLLLAGGGFQLDAGGRSEADLVQLASAAASGNVKLILSGLGPRSAVELIRIAQAGKGHVFFE